MALHNPDIIPEPFGNLIDRHSTARQERCKGVTHDMWRHPRHSLSAVYSENGLPKSYR